MKILLTIAQGEIREGLRNRWVAASRVEGKDMHMPPVERRRARVGRTKIETDTHSFPIYSGTSTTATAGSRSKTCGRAPLLDRVYSGISPTEIKTNLPK